MIVYLVYEGRYDDAGVTAVHASEEGARAAHRRPHMPEWVDAADGWRCGFSVPAPELPISGRRYCDFYVQRMEVSE